LISGTGIISQRCSIFPQKVLHLFLFCKTAVIPFVFTPFILFTFLEESLYSWAIQGEVPLGKNNRKVDNRKQDAYVPARPFIPFICTVLGTPKHRS